MVLKSADEACVGVRCCTYLGEVYFFAQVMLRLRIMQQPSFYEVIAESKIRRGKCKKCKTVLQMSCAIRNIV